MSTDTEHSATNDADAKPTSALLVVLAWLIVGVPLAYGLWQTLVKAFQLLG
jgi:hypothetical protein